LDLTIQIAQGACVDFVQIKLDRFFDRFAAFGEERSRRSLWSGARLKVFEQLVEPLTAEGNLLERIGQLVAKLTVKLMENSAHEVLVTRASISREALADFRAVSASGVFFQNHLDAGVRILGRLGCLAGNRFKLLGRSVKIIFQAQDRFFRS